MLYWLGVYGLAILAVLVPFILLYLTFASWWLIAATIRYVARAWKSIPTFRDRLHLSHR